MDWSKGYSATYYARRVDPITWRDTDIIELTGGSISRELSGLRESADIDCVSYDVGIERWIRVYLDTRQDGAAGHVALFTGLATSPSRDINGSVSANTLECYSVLKPVDDVALLRGWYAAAGRRGGDVINELLEATPAPVSIADDSPVLTESIIAEDGESCLTMVDKVLTAINWRIRIAGDGSVSVGPLSTSPAITFDPIDNDVLETELSVSADWYSVPNVFLAIAEDMTAIARDDSEDSPLSVPNRGREVWAVDTRCELAADESIGQYAERRLRESQIVQQTVEYDRRFYPDIEPGDFVRMHYPAQGIDGVYKIESQSIELGYGARTSEQISAAAPIPEDKAKPVLFYGFIDSTGDNVTTSDDDPLVALTEE